MVRFDINYSKKNIPIPSEKEYITQLISKVESVGKRMRWKALQFLGKFESNGKQTFGFKSTKCPPAIDELGPFDSDLQRMIYNIEFRHIRNKLLSKLSKHIKSIKKTKELLINADKSTNIYKISIEDYQKHLRNSITRTYKKSNRNRVNDINLDAKKNCAEVRNT